MAIRIIAGPYWDAPLQPSTSLQRSQTSATPTPSFSHSALASSSLLAHFRMILSPAKLRMEEEKISKMRFKLFAAVRIIDTGYLY